MSDATQTKPWFRRAPSLHTQRVLAMATLIAQGGITVTGATVRVTGSGLGCDTWPNCHEGSLVPVAGAAPAIHQAIEFGNRLLAFVLLGVALALVWALYAARRRTELKTLAIVSAVGVIFQAVIGGISVLLDLRWWAVALHFLPSMILVWICAVLYIRISEPDDGIPRQTFSSGARISAMISAIALSIVLVTGTMTTGAGPHAGDAEAGMQGRLEVDIDLMAHIHGWLMYVYLGATVVTVFLLHRCRADKTARRTGWALVALILVQAAIGILQYRMGVPRWSVPVHIGMSAVVTAITAFLWAHGVVRTPKPDTQRALQVN